MTTTIHDICTLIRIGISSTYLYFRDFAYILKISLLRHHLRFNQMTLQCDNLTMPAILGTKRRSNKDEDPSNIHAICCGGIFGSHSAGRSDCRPSKAQPSKGPDSDNIPANVKDAILQLYAADAVKRGAAAHRLGELSHKSALPYLIGLLHDGTGLKWQRPGSLNSTRTTPGWEAAESIAKIGGEQATAGVVESVKSDNRKRRENAIVALSLINDPKTAEIAVVSVGDDSWFVRDRSTNLLGRWKHATAFDDLVKLLKDDKCADVRATAAECLGKMGTQEQYRISLKHLPTRERACNVP